MMKINIIANSAITTVNENIDAKLILNNGNNIDEYGDVISSPIEYNVKVQPQTLSSGQRELFSGIYQQKKLIKCYLFNNPSGSLHSSQNGQSKLKFKPYGENEESYFTILEVLESFNGWECVLCARN